MKKNNKKYVFFYVILFVFCFKTSLTFSQYDNPEGAPSGYDLPPVNYNNPESVPSDSDPIATPIDEYIWILALLSILFAGYKYQSLKK